MQSGNPDFVKSVGDTSAFGVNFLYKRDIGKQIFVNNKLKKFAWSGHQNPKTITQTCFLDKDLAKFVRERIASRSWDIAFPNFQTLMIISILSELEKSVDSTRQTYLKTVWADINGKGTDNPALHEKTPVSLTKGSARFTRI